MSNITFLSHMGFFIKERFFTFEKCKKILDEIASADSIPATTVNIYDEEELDEESRKTKQVKISKTTKINIYECLYSLKNEIEQHYKVTLEGCEVPQVLLYRKGDFFKFHRDASDGKIIKTQNDNRKISTIIFLNDHSNVPQPGTYCGGELNLYGIIDQPGWDEQGFPVKGKTGLLVTFPSDKFHEVMPVTSGHRLTIVSWFY